MLAVTAQGTGCKATTVPPPPPRAFSHLPIQYFILYRGEGGFTLLHEACSNLAQTPSLTNDLHSCTSLGTMKQQILSSHIPLCHRRMVIATTLLGGEGGLFEGEHAIL